MTCSVSFTYFACGHLGKDKKIAQEILPVPEATRQKMVSDSTVAKIFTSLDRNESGKINCCLSHKNFCGPASLGSARHPWVPSAEALLWCCAQWWALSILAVPLRVPECPKRHHTHHPALLFVSELVGLGCQQVCTHLLPALNSSSSWWRGREMKRSDRSESCLDSCPGELTGWVAWRGSPKGQGWASTIFLRQFPKSYLHVPT